MFLQRYLTVIIATLSLVAGSSSAIADELEDILQAGIIKIAVPQDFPPFGSAGKDGQLEGYDVDVARLVAKELGVKLELTPVVASRRPLSLVSWTRRPASGNPFGLVTSTRTLARRPRSMVPGLMVT